MHQRLDHCGMGEPSGSLDRTAAAKAAPRLAPISSRKKPDPGVARCAVDTERRQVSLGRQGRAWREDAVEDGALAIVVAIRSSTPLPIRRLKDT